MARVMDRTRVVWTFPFAPVSLNEWQRMHWARRGRLKNAWYEQVWARQRSRDFAVPKGCKHVTVAADIVFRRNAHRDLSNYEAVLWKVLLDALKKAEVIPDDTDRYVTCGRVRLLVDKGLLVNIRDPRQTGATRVALIAQPPDPTMF